MINRNPTHAALALALVVSLLAACASDDPVATSDAAGVGELRVPSIEQVSRAVALDDEDRAIVAAALEEWGGATNEGGFLHRGGMQFVATVAPALDNRQLADMVDLLRELREERWKERRKGGRDRQAGDAHLAKLTESLELSAEQQSKMRALYAEMRVEMRKLHDARREGAADKGQEREIMVALRDAHRRKLAGILSDDQLSRLDALHEERRVRMIERRLERTDDAVDARADWLTAVLGLSAEQEATLRASLRAVAGERKDALKSALERRGDSRAGAFGGLRDSHETAVAALEGELTPEQSERLAIVRRLHARG